MSHELYVGYTLSACFYLRLFAQAHSTYLYSHPHSGNNPNEITSTCQTVVCTFTVTGALFTKIKKWSQSKYLAGDGWLKRMCCVHTQRNANVREKGILVSFGTTDHRGSWSTLYSVDSA